DHNTLVGPSLLEFLSDLCLQACTILEHLDRGEGGSHVTRNGLDIVLNYLDLEVVLVGVCLGECHRLVSLDGEQYLNVEVGRDAVLVDDRDLSASHSLTVVRGGTVTSESNILVLHVPRN